MVRRHCWEALRDLPVAFAVDADRCASDLGSSLAREPENVEPERIEPSCVPFRGGVTARRYQSGPILLGQTSVSLPT
jgi:hypothetical protein